MKIIEYEDKYLEDVKDVLVELEEYIVSIDKDKLDFMILHSINTNKKQVFAKKVKKTLIP